MPQSVEDYTARIVNDPRWFLETFCSIRHSGGQLGPFIFNRPQHFLYESAYVEAAPNVWVRRAFDETHGKGRQFGDSTFQIGLMYHQWATGSDFGPAFVGKVLAFADDTAQELRDIPGLLHESACDTIRSLLGVDPWTILPRGDVQNAHELADSTRGCKLIFASERTKGAGRATTANWLYITDLSEWTTYEDAIAGYAGSLSKTGREVVVRDFTGRGPGNAAHAEYMRLKRLQASNPRVRVHFIGVDQIGYPEGYLEAQRDRFTSDTSYRREYPKTEADMFRGNPNARFDPDWVEKAADREPRYLVDYMTDEQIRAECAICHAIDSAEGTPGGDFACIKTRDAKTGLEILPPYREQASPDTTAQAMKRIHDRFPGLINALRKNHGSAVISRLQALGLGAWLYRMNDIGNRDGKIGLDENGLTVPQMQTEYEIMLKDGLINLPSENGRMEATIFGLQKNGKIEAPPGFHDDELVADMACVMVFRAAVRRASAIGRTVKPFVQQSARQQ